MYEEREGGEREEAPEEAPPAVVPKLTYGGDALSLLLHSMRWRIIIVNNDATDDNVCEPSMEQRKNTARNADRWGDCDNNHLLLNHSKYAVPKDGGDNGSCCHAGEKDRKRKQMASNGGSLNK